MFMLNMQINANIIVTEAEKILMCGYKKVDYGNSIFCKKADLNNRTNCLNDVWLHDSLRVSLLMYMNKMLVNAETVM